MIRHYLGAAERFTIGQKSFIRKALVPSMDIGIISKELVERRVDYGGNVVSVRRDLIAAKVIPAWPSLGEAAVCDVARLLDSELADDLADPARCLLPESQWPEITPTSKVHASDSEWYAIVKAAGERGMMVEVQEADIFVNNHGDKVLAGAMGVDKLKESADGPIEMLRFISILCPINAHFRKLEGTVTSCPIWVNSTWPSLGRRSKW